MIVFNAIFPVVIIVLLGWYLQRVGILNDKVTHTITRLVYFVLFPAALFSFTANTDLKVFEKKDYIIVLYVSTFCMCLLSFICYWRSKEDNKFKHAVIFNLHTSVSNIAFIGYPIFLALYGDEGLSYVVIGVFLISCILTPISIVALNYSTRQSWQQSLRSLVKVLMTDPLLLSVSLPATRCRNKYLAPHADSKRG